MGSRACYGDIALKFVLLDGLLGKGVAACSAICRLTFGSAIHWRMTFRRASPALTKVRAHVMVAN